MKRLIITIIILLAASNSLAFYEQNSQSGGLPGEYLGFWTGSVRALAMGDGYSALADGPSGQYYNPASIAGAYSQQIDVLYTPLLGGGKYGTLFYSYALSLKNVLGLGIISLTSADAVKRNEWGGYEGKFNDEKRTIMLTAAHSLKDYLNIGGTFKFVSQKIDDYQDTGIGLDIGLKYLPSDRFSIAMAMQNILTPEIKLIEHPDKFPLNFKFGAAANFLYNKLVVSADMNLFDIPGQATFRWGGGAEYNIYKILYLRAGINYKQITAGLGVRTKKFGFSYAARYSPVGLFHSVGTSYIFGQLLSSREKEAARRERLIQQREDMFEKWKEERQSIFFEKLNRSHSQLEDEIELARYKNKELESLIKAVLDMKRGDYKRAEAALKKILKESPDSSDANMLLGIIQDELAREFSFSKMMGAYNNGNYQLALIESQKADRLHPQYIHAKVVGLLSSARLNILEGNYSSAIEELNKVIEIKPENKIATTLLKKVQRLKEIKDESF